MVSLCRFRPTGGHGPVLFLRPLLRVEGGYYIGFPRCIKRGLHFGAEPSGALEIPSGQSVGLAVIFQWGSLGWNYDHRAGSSEGLLIYFYDLLQSPAAGTIG